MIAVNTVIDVEKIHKVLCPECRSRICDVVVSKRGNCQHKYKVIFDGNSDCLIAIKCKKCGKVIGLGITQLNKDT